MVSYWHFIILTFRVVDLCSTLRISSVARVLLLMLDVLRLLLKAGGCFLIVLLLKQVILLFQHSLFIA